MGKPEAKVEDHLIKRAKEVRAEVRKVAWVARKGAPDRFVMTEGANVMNFWVECKAGKDGRLSVLQEREIARMRERGEVVYVLTTREAIDLIFDRILLTGR